MTWVDADHGMHDASCIYPGDILPLLGVGPFVATYDQFAGPNNVDVGMN
jgi:hypothetical protein